MKYNKLSRRMFLQGSGSTLLAIPFLPSLFPEFAHAASTPAELKYVQVCSAQHAWRSKFWPNELKGALAPYTQIDTHFKSNSLEAIIAKQGKIADALGAQWTPLAPYMNLITGMVMNATNDKHNSTVPSTASCPNLANDPENPSSMDPANPYSLDWYAEKYLNLVGPKTAIPAIRTHLAYRHGKSGYLHYEHEVYCYKGHPTSGKKVAIRNPEMHDVAELEALLKSTGSATIDPALANRMKLIDAVQEDFKRLMNDRRISSVDKTRLSETVDLWNEAENRRASTGGGGMSCQSTFANKPLATDNPRQGWQVYNEYLMDLLSVSLACGLTKVATAVISHAGPELYTNFETYDRLHAVQHDPANSDADANAMASWRADRMAYFANRLRTLTDQNGLSLLESTLMHWGWEYAEAGHDPCGSTSILIGKAAGRLQTGLHLNCLGKLGPQVNYYSVYADLPPINKVHMTILKAFGLTDAEIEINGQPGFGDYGNLTVSSNDHRTGGIGFSNANRAKWYTTEEKRKPLPILKT